MDIFVFELSAAICLHKKRRKKTMGTQVVFSVWAEVDLCIHAFMRNLGI